MSKDLCMLREASQDKGELGNSMEEIVTNCQGAALRRWAQKD